MSRSIWLDQDRIKNQLSEFFRQQRRELTKFGSTVNQTFEAYVFAAVANWYRRQGWSVEFVHPRRQRKKKGQTTDSAEREPLRLKFSTRGRPDNYSYALCRKGDERVQIRHQLRVATRYYQPDDDPRANICLDVAVIGDLDLSGYSTDSAGANEVLVTFAEAKHMSAYAELVASFIGIVHELLPEQLEPGEQATDYLQPFLFVSGRLLHTARGIQRTIEERGLRLQIFNYQTDLFFGTPVPTMSPPPKSAV